MSTCITTAIVCLYCLSLFYGISATIEIRNGSLVKNITSESVQLSLKGVVFSNITGLNITLYKLECKELRLCKQNETHFDRFVELIEWKGLSPSTMYKVIVVIYTKTNVQTYTLHEEFETKSKTRRQTKSDPDTRKTFSRVARSSKNQTQSAVSSTESTSLPETPSTKGGASHDGTKTQGGSAKKGLIWWVGVVGGAGLGMIILLSILTVLFHMPWRRQKLIQLRNHPKKAEDNMYDKIKGHENSNKLEELPTKNESRGPIPGKECVDNGRYQKTQSAVSWGTDFDTQDSIQDGAYANTDFLFIQSNNNSTSNS